MSSSTHGVEYASSSGLVLPRSAQLYVSLRAGGRRERSRGARREGEGALGVALPSWREAALAALAEGACEGEGASRSGSMARRRVAEAGARAAVSPLLGLGTRAANGAREPGGVDVGPAPDRVGRAEGGACFEGGVGARLEDVGGGALPEELGGHPELGGGHHLGGGKQSEAISSNQKQIRCSGEATTWAAGGREGEGGRGA